MKRGFTLVELSIVLIIIGLLIGGILTAQSMISTTKVQAQTRQIQQLDIAITNFKGKYNQLPGDSSLFGNIGNNNGTIDSGSEAEFTGESRFVWKELQQGVSLYPDYSFNTGDWCNSAPCVFKGSNINIIPAVINDKTGIVVGRDTGTQDVGDNAYMLGTFDVSADIWQGTHPVQCADILSIDRKIDDGLKVAGNVQAVGCGPNYSLIGPSNLGVFYVRILSQTIR